MRKNKIVLIALLGIFICYLMLSAEKYFYRKSWEKETSPLPKETIADLCKTFLLRRDDRLCDGSRDVYAADFSEVLRSHFSQRGSIDTPRENATFTYQDVQNEIGKYLLECQDVIHQQDPNISYFRCFYDFRGDWYQREAFYFYYPENTLFNIRSGTSSDD